MSERIDHVVINVEKQLDEAAEQYRQLGFTLTPRGHHSLGSSNHLAVFGSDYLELLGVEPQNANKFQYPFPTGLSGLVFKTADAATLWSALSARSVPLEGTEPRAFFRPVELQNGDIREAHFRTVRVAPEEVPNGRVFFCQHLLPELVWRPEWQEHANGAIGITEYAYITPDPKHSAKVLERVFGASTVTHDVNGAFYHTDGATVAYLKPETFRTRYGLAVEQLSAESERALALTIRTRSLEQARSVLEKSGITDLVRVGGRLVVSPQFAAGVVLAFEE